MLSGTPLAMLIAFAVTVTLTPAMRRLAQRTGLLDLPGPRKIHHQPMPLLGGVAVYLGWAFALLAVRDDPLPPVGKVLWAATALLVVIGTLDDKGWLHHQIKLFVGMPLAAGWLVGTGLRVEFAKLWGASTAWIDPAVTLFWLVGITASFSILDHMDGLCAGVAAIAALFFALLAKEPSGTLLAATTAAAAAGFLAWNFSPATIFLGDGGAMGLGFLLAAISLSVRPAADPMREWLARGLVLLVPIFDTLLVCVSRLRRGRLPFAAPGKDHTAHRLTALGIPQPITVLLLYLVGLVGGLLALAVTRWSLASSLALGVSVAAIALTALIALERGFGKVPEEK